ncbi:MAG TPA: hypothetical protein VFI03_00040 [Solirubrobacterales bacterium]|nr:hypothetical protein [Solirubrobacterales bacterium]
MSHKLKSLSLALVAVFALGAVVASSASAGTFTADPSATITGKQISGTITGGVKTQHEFTTKAGTIKCSTATFHGVATAAATTEQTLTATYSGCFLGGVVPVHVRMNSCDYLFTAGNTVGGNPDTVEVGAHVKCSNLGDKIEVEATGSTCKITIPAQGPLTGIETHNRTDASTNRMDVEATIDVHSITYEVHGSCPNSPAQTVHFNDGTYRGVATLTSDSAGGITVH